MNVLHRTRCMGKESQRVDTSAVLLRSQAFFVCKNAPSQDVFSILQSSTCLFDCSALLWTTLQGTITYPPKMAFWVDDFPNFPRWDMYPFPGGYHYRYRWWSRRNQEHHRRWRFLRRLRCPGHRSEIFPCETARKNKKVNNQYSWNRVGMFFVLTIVFLYVYKCHFRPCDMCHCLTIRWCNSCEMFIREYLFIFRRAPWKNFWSRMVSNHQINVEDWICFGKHGSKHELECMTLILSLYLYHIWTSSPCF